MVGTRGENQTGTRLYIIILRGRTALFPSPLVGEGGAKRRMRGYGLSMDLNPSPVRDASHRVHPLPQGERGRRAPQPPSIATFIQCVIFVEPRNSSAARRTPEAAPRPC